MHKEEARGGPQGRQREKMNFSVPSADPFFFSFFFTSGRKVFHLNISCDVKAELSIFWLCSSRSNYS